MQDYSKFPQCLDLHALADLLGISDVETARLVADGWLDDARVEGKPGFDRDRVVDWVRSRPDSAS